MMDSLMTYMEKLKRCSFILVLLSVMIVVSFALCLAAEFKKSKKGDLWLDGKMCSLPGSSALELGIAALICISIGQVIGCLFVCQKFRSMEKYCSCCEVGKPSFSCILLVISWISFGVALILIGGATSMSQTQPYGEGWLDGECYVVKDGVYIGAAMLGLLALGSTLGSAAITINESQAEENIKTHAHFDQRQ